jgi:hypothetical protein
LISLQERKSHFEIIPSFLAVKKDKRNWVNSSFAMILEMLGRRRIDENFDPSSHHLGNYLYDKNQVF